MDDYEPEIKYEVPSTDKDVFVYIKKDLEVFCMIYFYFIPIETVPNLTTSESPI